MTPEHTCLHEEQIQGISRKTAELEAKNGFKEQRINELIEDNRRIEAKIDNLTDTVNKLMLQSVKDDKDIANRVTTLETKIDTQEKIIRQYEEKAQKERDDDRVKTNQYLAIIGTGIGILSFIFAYILH